LKNNQRIKKTVATEVVAELAAVTGPKLTRNRHNILTAIEAAIQECGVEQLWHWGKTPVKPEGEVLMPDDVPIEARPPWASYSAMPASKWLVSGTIPGYWLSPGERKDVQEVELLRISLKTLEEIRATITSEPIECKICIGDEEEPFFGESWTLSFPDLPIIDDDLALDHPLKGLNHRFMREKDPGGLAIMANQRAQELRNRKARGGWTSVDWILDKMYAEQAQAESERLLQIKQHVVQGAGEKIVPLEDPAGFYLADTLKEPTMISVGAAENRLQLARDAGVLKLAVDASMTADANNSLEKMLCHQMAGLHKGAMKMLQQGLSQGIPNVEATRALGTAARMMLTFQSGMETLQKIKNKGKQTVVVKHVQVVQVQDGGQAVVAGKVGRDGTKTGGKE
jgi:hypothetical protein